MEHCFRSSLERRREALGSAPHAYWHSARNDRGNQFWAEPSAREPTLSTSQHVGVKCFLKHRCELEDES